MRHPAFQRRMTQLALLAMLLLALMPTMHRLLAARAAPDGAGWVELCTGTGLKLVKLGGGAADPAAAATHAEQGLAGDPSAGDCAWCPLLHAVLAVTLALLLVDRLRHRDAAVTLRSAARTRALHPCGLGSRGPPLPA